ncbi:ribbon-helix-helix domain-containing protein [Haloimpatiens sp. FM7315]|uniref:ribbon-helix-helix domain-containing protein n=1 Tax=Haloimpatiens sp. FM7315 TaxID=3298609 RepID=UPI00370AD68A
MASNNGLVNRHKVSFSIDKNLFKMLDDLSKETMIPKTRLVDKALELLAKEYNREIDTE